MFEDEEGEVDVAVDVGAVFNVSVVKGAETLVCVPCTFDLHISWSAHNLTLV